MMRTFITSLRAIFILTILTGIVYPVLMIIFSHFIFPHRANGSLITINGEIVGSELIAQKFQGEKYFWSRPSAIDYNPLPSGASNLGPTSRSLQKIVEQRKTFFTEKNFLSSNVVLPTEIVFSSGSGVDPHISPEAALLQVQRVSFARGFDEVKVNKLRSTIQKTTELLQFGFLGQPRINVLLLNIELDKIR
jgi:potassium-transporting ATPase KdpC subunit